MAPPEDPTQGSDTDPRALDQFRSQLDPYGSWVNDPKYGTIWVPDRNIVGENFSPYVTNGHWALDSNNDWVWVSDFAFGDVVFHYGRWVWTSYGWSWIPGDRYAPAWVTWRVPTSSYDYVGWAPAAPDYIWQDGYAVSVWYPPPFYWVFLPSAYLFSPFPYHYLVRNPGYIRYLGGATHRYFAGRPGLAFRGPPLAIARVPRAAYPVARVPLGRSGMVATSFHGGVGTGARTGVAYRASTPRTVGAPRSIEAPRSYSTSAYRSYSAPAYRSFSSGAYRSYSAPAYRSYSGGVYHPYSGGAYHSYSAPAYHSYSAPAYHPYSGGAYHSYSAPSFHSGGGGGHFGGGGGGHFGGGGGGHFGGGGGGHFGGGGGGHFGGGHR